MRPHRAEHTFKRENALEPEGASSKKITIHTRDVFHFDDKIDLLFEDKNNRKQKWRNGKISITPSSKGKKKGKEGVALNKQESHEKED